jgi:hypothetical protein
MQKHTSGSSARTGKSGSSQKKTAKVKTLGGDTQHPTGESNALQGKLQTKGKSNRKKIVLLQRDLFEAVHGDFLADLVRVPAFKFSPPSIGGKEPSRMRWSRTRQRFVCCCGERDEAKCFPGWIKPRKGLAIREYWYCSTCDTFRLRGCGPAGKPEGVQISGVYVALSIAVLCAEKYRDRSSVQELRFWESIVLSLA